MARKPPRTGTRYPGKPEKKAREDTATSRAIGTSHSVLESHPAAAPPPPRRNIANSMVETSDTGPQTLQQERAAYALEQVRGAVAALTDAERKEFRSYAASFPAMIKMNGLGQAAAFYCSQEGRAYNQLYNILSDWLRKPQQPYCEQAHLLDGITREDMHTYRWAQAEALLLLDWVKKFAKAYVREE